MPDYQSMYEILFEAIMDAMDCLEKKNTVLALDVLMKAQQAAEWIFMESESDTL